MKPASTKKGITVYSVRAGLKPKPEWVLFPMYISAGVCCTLWDPIKKTTQYTNIYLYKCVYVCVCAEYLSSSAVQTTEGRGSLGEEVEVERRLQLCLSVNSEQERVRGGVEGV